MTEIEKAEINKKIDELLIAQRRELELSLVPGKWDDIQFHFEQEKYPS